MVCTFPKRFNRNQLVQHVTLLTHVSLKDPALCPILSLLNSAHIFSSYNK
jgi:hypothetical protein